MKGKSDVVKAYFYSFAMQHNVNILIQFHNAFLYLTGKEADEIVARATSVADKEVRRRADIEGRIFKDQMSPLVLRSTFLLLYSFLEEFLYIEAKQLHLTHTFTPRSGSIQRFKAIFSTKLDIEKDWRWTFLCDCEALRDCTLHANGRLDFLTVNRRKKIEPLLRKYKNQLKSKLSRLEFTSEFIEKFRQVIQSLLPLFPSEERLEIGTW